MQTDGRGTNTLVGVAPEGGEGVRHSVSITRGGERAGVALARGRLGRSGSGRKVASVEHEHKRLDVGHVGGDRNRPDAVA
jgi:hypothetical protein